MFFISFQKIFSFSRKSKFRILDIKFHDFIKWLSTEKKYILLSNLGSKHSLLMKFGLFISYYKRKKFMKKLYKNCDLKVPGSFVFAKK